MLHLTHEENIEKTTKVLRKLGTREGITLILDTVKFCASKQLIERSQGQCQKGCRIGKKWSYLFGNIVEVWWNRVEGGNRNLVNYFQNGPWMPFECSSLDCFCFCGSLRQTVILISYVVFDLQHSWYIQERAVGALLNMLVNMLVMWKYILFWSKLLAR